MALVIFNMVKGIVKRFNTRKGFGYILPEGGEKEIVVYWSSIQVAGNALHHLKEGDEVEFTIEQSQKGEEAKNVLLLKHRPKPRKIRRNGHINLGRFHSPAAIENSNPRVKPIKIKDPYGKKKVIVSNEPETEEEKRARLRDQRMSND